MAAQRYTLALLLCLGTVTQLARAAATLKENDKLKLDQFKQIELGDQLSDQEISSMMKNFGQLVGDTLKSELDKVINEVDEQKAKRGASVEQLDGEQLGKLKAANEALSGDLKQRIELAGETNKGEITQSLFGDLGTSKTFLGQIGQRLSSTSAYISQQMSSLAGLAPKIRGQIGSIPGKLRKLMQWPDFMSYKSRFNKSYNSLGEELYKHMVYTQSMVQAGAHNLKFLLGRSTYLLKPTEFADTTEKEYHDAFNNPAAEQEPEEGPGMSPEQRAKLVEMAKSNKNIFGLDMQKLAEDKKLAPGSRSESRRRKRSPWQFVDNSELDDEESEEDEDMMDASESSSAMDLDDSELGNELDEAKLVDDYAAEMSIDAQMDDIDALNDIMDEALDSKTKFVGVDLRQTGCVIEPERQDRCGACYAFVTSAAASYYNCVERKLAEPIRYSPRFVSDCGRYLVPEGERPPVNGCRGGKLSSAFNFVSKAGVYEFLEYDLARVDSDVFKTDVCAFPRPGSIDSWAPEQVPMFQRTRVTYLKLDDVDLHLRTIGPVFVNIRTWKNFGQQGAGIYGDLEDSDSPVIHSMWIVGHDKDRHGHDYYILWNSHGITWGEDGFVRIYAHALDYFKVYIGGLTTLIDLDRYFG